MWKGHSYPPWQGVHFPGCQIEAHRCENKVLRKLLLAGRDGQPLSQGWLWCQPSPAPQPCCSASPPMQLHCCSQRVIIHCSLYHGADQTFTSVPAFQLSSHRIRVPRHGDMPGASACWSLQEAGVSLRKKNLDYDKRPMPWWFPGLQVPIFHHSFFSS